MFHKVAQGRVMNTENFALKKNEGDMDQITSFFHPQTVVLEYCIKF